MKTCADFARLLQAFFTDRLMNQRQASPHTVASYRDTFRLLLQFAQQRLHKAPSALALEDLKAPFIGTFLDHLEKDRGNSARTRNVRLAAIHSFFRYVALEEPTLSAMIQRVLAMPTKRYDRKPLEFLIRPEIDAIVATPDQQTWLGRRDYTLLLVDAQTGLRVSELTGLQRQDVVLGTGAHVRCQGKGRKERCTPLSEESAAALRRWLRECGGASTDPLFPSSRGGPLSRDAVEYLLAKHVATARKKCPPLRKKHVTMHVLRHSAAMDLHLHGVDRTVIALWLGHESVETTQVYLQANLEMKQKALAKATPFNVRPFRYRPDDHLLAFLKSL
jgi:site-specific recombinase XerD